MMSAIGAAAVLATGCATTKSSSGVLSAPKPFNVDSQTPPAAVSSPATGATVRGSISAAEVGGSIGYLIGRRMDVQARELAQQLPGASVRRLGEGITVSFPEASLFALDSDSLTPAAREQLSQFAASLQKFAGTDVMITGHTGSGASARSRADDMTERRAGVAAAFMTSEGVARTRLRTSGRGDSEPVTSNSTEAGRTQNRRVEMAIYADDAMRHGAP